MTHVGASDHDVGVTTSLAHLPLTVVKHADHTAHTATVQVDRAENLRILLADAKTPGEIALAESEINSWTERAVEHAVHLVRSSAQDEYRAAHPETVEHPYYRALFSVTYGVQSLDITVEDFLVTATLKVAA